MSTPAPKTVIELLLMSDFGRLQPDRAHELAAAAQTPKRESDERPGRLAKQPAAR